MTSTATRETTAGEPFVPDWTFGDKLRKTRRVAGLTQTAFALALDVKEKTYAAWELDTTVPPNQVAVAKRVELVTGVRATWLLGLDGPDGPPPAASGQAEEPRNTLSCSGRERPVVVPFPLVTRPESLPVSA